MPVGDDSFRPTRSVYPQVVVLNSNRPNGSPSGPALNNSVVELTTSNTTCPLVNPNPDTVMPASIPTVFETLTVLSELPVVLYVAVANTRSA